MAYDTTSGLRQMVYSVNVPNPVKISKYMTGFGKSLRKGSVRGSRNACF